MQFSIGQRVARCEAREVTGATVIAIDTSDPDETLYRISYDGGGEGWWPQSALTSAA